MSAHPPFHDCDYCGARIGVYEPARIELADGTVLTGSPLGVGTERRGDVVRAWHRTCADARRDALAQ